MYRQPSLSKKALTRAVALASLPVAAMTAQPVLAQDDGQPRLEEVVVTASRRNETVQDIPINISAVSAEKIGKLRLFGINEIARYVPGLTVIDRGPRDEVPDILVRGLNTAGLGPGFNSDTTATYFGDIPIDLDIKPIDLERVEVLIGPQGTLYGQGTLGGAIRYLPQRADTEAFTVDVRGILSQNAESDDLLNDVGITLNVPIIEDKLALRVNVDRVDDPGFVDYPFVVREPGVSNPEPDFSNPAEVDANLRSVNDVNSEETVSTRVNLRWTPTDWLDANFWYLNQDTEAGGRQINHRLAFGTGEYESGYRYLEPLEYENELLSLEVKADLGFAEATFVYGETEYEEVGQRDQSDLLLSFELSTLFGTGYELFPSFSAFTKEVSEEESETVELRLVSQYDGPVTWVVGYFRNEFKLDSTSQEFAPNYGQFGVDNFGFEAARADDLEYQSLTVQDELEQAIYGEVSYRMLDDSLEFTVGYRRYEFEADNRGDAILATLETAFFGLDPNADIDALLEESSFDNRNDGDDSGNLLKLNVAYDLDEDNMIYATYSEGYRNGGVNTQPACTAEDLEDAANGLQVICAKPDEVFFDPDEIENYELGYKGFLMDGAMSVNLALFYIDWSDLQVATITDLGALGIVGNGSTAESKGLEFQGAWAITSNFDVNVTYAYTKAELTEDAPGLVGDFTALSGSRLPGHAEHQGTFNATYYMPIGDMELALNYGFVYQGDVFNITGGDEDTLVDVDGNPADFGGESIPAYDVHHLSATLSQDMWTLQAFVDNVFDEYYVTGTRRERQFLVDERTGPGLTTGLFTQRSYAQFMGAPRTIGIRATYSF